MRPLFGPAMGVGRNHNRVQNAPRASRALHKPPAERSTSLSLQQSAPRASGALQEVHSAPHASRNALQASRQWGDDGNGHDAWMGTITWMFQEKVSGPKTASWNTHVMEDANGVARDCFQETPIFLIYLPSTISPDYSAYLFGWNKAVSVIT